MHNFGERTQSPPQTRAAAVEKFKQITNSYEILVDDRKRTAYDLRSNESQCRWHNRQEHSNAGQSRQSNRSGGDTKSSPNAAQSRRRNRHKRRAATALRFLGRVCVEFWKFTAQVIVEALNNLDFDDFDD